MSDDLDFIDGEEDNVEHTYLTFQVGGEEFAVPVVHVTEIVRLQRSFAVPDVPAYIKGVINLRGKVIPLLDVRARFGLAEAAFDDRTVIVVLELGETFTGLVVDGVSEVVEIMPEQIDARPKWRSQTGGSSMVSGVGKRGNTVSFILDVNALVGAELALATSKGAAAQAAATPA